MRPFRAGSRLAWAGRCLVMVLVAVSQPWFPVLQRASASGGLSVQVAAVTQSVVNLAASQTPATAGCPAGTVLVGGGIHAFFATGDIVSGTTYEPINGLVVKGTYPSDASGSTTTVSNDPAFWTGLGGFAGQSESGDDVTGFAMCSTGGPAHTEVVSATVVGPTANSTTATATAPCPSGTTLVGGGATTNNPSATVTPSLKPDGSYPSDALGSTTTATNLSSWSAVGESGGRGDPLTTTTAFAVCALGTGLQTVVVRADVVGHPAGAGNANPGQDPVATATATCPAGTALLSGGALADSSAPTGLQQGVHLRGSYPSTAAAAPVANRATNPMSWSSIVQSGGQVTPGTNTHAYALCAQVPAVVSGPMLAGGRNIAGQLCNGTTTDSSTAVAASPPANANIVAVAAGAFFSVALRADGTVLACGRNNFGQLGNGTTSDSTTPVSVAMPAGVSVTAVSANGYQALALSSTGRVFGWGYNAFGQLGDGTTTNRSVPVPVAIPAGTGVTAIAAGWSYGLALTSSGSVLSWGWNAEGELGDGTRMRQLSPVPVLAPAVSVTAIAAGWNHNVALRADGTIVGWGLNNFGQVGDGTHVNRPAPVAVTLPAGAAVTAISTGGGHSLALRSDGGMLAWGWNSNGQLGDGTATSRASPVSVALPAGVTASAIAAGSFHSLALTSPGGVLGWGSNSSGQLLDGTTTDRLTPVASIAPANAGVTTIAGGWSFTLVVKPTNPALPRMRPVRIGSR